MSEMATADDTVAEENKGSDGLTDAERQERFTRPYEFYQSLKRSEFASLADVAKHQESVVTDMLDFALDYVPFHRRRLSRILRPNGKIDLSRWLDVPVITRSELERHATELVPVRFPHQHGWSEPGGSSGTTGRESTAIRLTALEKTAVGCISHRFADAFDVDWSCNVIMLRSRSVRAVRSAAAGTPPDRWGPAWRDPATRGRRIVKSLHLPPETQLQEIAALAPAYINTLPTNLYELCAYVAENGIDPPDIRGVFSVGETPTDDLRHECRTHLGCEIFDVYASSECGVLAIQCPEGHGYHLQPESSVVEVLKEDGTPCGPGETGRVTATALYNYAMPLIRYQFEDLATVGGLCPCGRAAPLLSDVLGKISELFRRPDGTYFRPQISTERLREIAGYRRWQVVQTGEAAAELRLTGTGDYDRSALTDAVADMLGEDFAVTVSEGHTFLRKSGGKFSRSLRAC